MVHPCHINDGRVIPFGLRSADEDDKRDRMPTLGYAESREAAMAAFAKSWRRK